MKTATAILVVLIPALAIAAPPAGPGTAYTMGPGANWKSGPGADSKAGPLNAADRPTNPDQKPIAAFALDQARRERECAVVYPCCLLGSRSPRVFAIAPRNFSDAAYALRARAGLPQMDAASSLLPQSELPAACHNPHVSARVSSTPPAARQG
jgi:hypothetical protein